MSETCPKCGAEVRCVHITSSGRPRNVFECGRDDGGPPSVPCLERQITNLRAENAALDDHIEKLQAQNACLQSRYDELAVAIVGSYTRSSDPDADHRAILHIAAEAEKE